MNTIVVFTAIIHTFNRTLYNNTVMGPRHQLSRPRPRHL